MTIIGEARIEDEGKVETPMAEYIWRIRSNEDQVVGKFAVSGVGR